jgi:hypothetical protein
MRTILSFLDEIGYPKGHTQLKLFGITELNKLRIIKQFKIKTMNQRSLNTAKRYADELSLKKVDITADFFDWLRISYGLSNSFEEEGREIFHKVSSAGYPNYNKDETDKLFNDCLKRNKERKPGKKKVTVGTFIKMAQDAGIELPEESDYFDVETGK